MSDHRLDFSGKVVIVTGGGKGVGLGITTRFLEHKATVIICGRSEPESLPCVGDNRAETAPDPSQPANGNGAGEGALRATKVRDSGRSIFVVGPGLASGPDR